MNINILDNLMCLMKLLGSLVRVLDDQLAASFNGPVEGLPQVHSLFLLSESVTPFEIPSIMVPPEDFDFGALTEDSASRRIMMPRLSLRFFDSEVGCRHAIAWTPLNPLLPDQSSPGIVEWLHHQVLHH